MCVKRLKSVGNTFDMREMAYLCGKLHTYVGNILDMFYTA